MDCIVHWGCKESDTAEGLSLHFTSGWCCFGSLKILFIFKKGVFQCNVYKRNSHSFLKYIISVFIHLFILVWPQGIWDPSSQARDQIQSPCSGIRES